MKEKVLKPRPPRVGPEVFECGYDAGRGESPPLWCDHRHRVEADWPVSIRRVQIAHVVDAGAGYSVQYVECEVPVRIDDCHPVPCNDVSHCEVEHECRFAAARLTDNVEMPFALLRCEVDAGTAGCCCNRKRRRFHNVAPAPGENPCCGATRGLPFMRQLCGD